MNIVMNRRILMFDCSGPGGNHEQSHEQKNMLDCSGSGGSHEQS